MKNIIDSIEDLKCYTNSSISNIQSANIPSIYKLNLERRYSFITHGFTHNVMQYSGLIYVSNNIPFSINQIRHTYSGTLEELVKSNEVMPFLIFVNKEFVKWSEIIIVKDCKYSYIIFPNIKYDTEIYSIECILIPRDVKYKENTKSVKAESIFIFDKDNKAVTETVQGEKYTTISLLNTKDIYYENKLIKNPAKIQKVDLDMDNHIAKDNLIIFCNGYLANSFIDLNIIGLNLFEIDNGGYHKNNKLEYKLFYYNKSNKTKEHINSINNKKSLVEEIMNTNQVPEFISQLNEKFDFKYNRKKSYEENIFNSLNYIMNYNSSLLNNVYKEKSNIVSRLYKGKDIISKMDFKGYVTMSRRVDGDSSSHVIIFKNGLLYKGYSELIYKNKNFIFPVIGIEEEDKLEFVFFKDVDNRRIKLSFSSLGDDCYVIDSSIKMDNMKLFTMNVESQDFNIERKDSVQYEIDYTYNRIDDTKIEIYPDNPFYYDRRLSLASKRQFRYAFKIAKDNCIDIELPDDFLFCNDKERFMVFVNGRKIDLKNFKVTIIKPTRPFDDLSVYINLELKKGDKLEVFYVPDRMEEIVIEPTIPLSGNIIIDKTKLNYNLSKDLYLFFINGKKINPNQIIDIDQTKIKIISNIKTLSNLCIIKHIEDDEILSTLFDVEKDQITKIIDSLSEDDLNKLYKGNSINNKEKDIYEDQLSMKTVMHKIISDYYMRPYINTGDDMIFDLDTSDLDTDSEGNIIITPN